MNVTEFRASLDSNERPAALSPALQALWLDGKGDWNAAHEQLQHGSDHDCAWVHAYLHRKEGDLSNASYWYRRAGQPTASGPQEAEWEAIVRTLLVSAD